MVGTHVRVKFRHRTTRQPQTK